LTGITSIPKMGNKFYVPHFDSKACGTAYFKKKNVPFTEFLPSFYYENFITFNMGPQVSV
jgi:hypothetical protein